MADSALAQVRIDSMASVSMPAVPKRPERILVVDDEPQIRRLIETGLRRAGYEVHAAGSAAVALESAERLSCGLDLLITDIAMPDITGTELIRRIRMVCPQVEVMAITGALEIEAGNTPRNYPILRKPFAPKVLIDAVKRVLAAHF
jgi:CheY-like chemotaxis protein